MKNSIKGLILAFILVPIFSFAQQKNWMQLMETPNTNFYTIQRAFNNHFKQVSKKEKLGKKDGKHRTEGEEGFKIFKRWENFIAPRVYPTGNFPNALKVYQERLKVNSTYRSKNVHNKSINWTLIGPTNVPSYGGGAGRVNVIRFNPQNANTVYLGTPDGGLWKSTNGGVSGSWVHNSDQLPSLGISDIAINPNDTNVIYIGTGDADASDINGVGLLKSVDDGATWNTTGLSYLMNQAIKVSRILINPQDTNVVLVATNYGIYRSNDAAATFRRVYSGNIKDMEYKPGDTSIVYAARYLGGFYKSTNGGQSFSNISLPSSASNLIRIAIAVTPANPNYVYLLAANSSDYNFNGLYLSTNSGTSFTAQSTSPNLLGYNPDGSDNGGQGWYDLALAASPTNASVVLVGGVNIWRSTDAGVDWTLNAHWTGNGAPYVHADIHDIEFYPGSGSRYFAGCDGGVFETSNSGGTWSDHSDGLSIGEVYGLSISTTTPNYLISGWQDNGTNFYNSSSWYNVIGGDGMDCMIDPTSNNIQYGELYYGDFYRTTNGWSSGTNIVSGITETGGWITPWLIDPQSHTTLFAGFNNVWKSTSSGDSWTKISNWGNSNTIVALAVAPSNDSYIYAARVDDIFMTSNGGTTWTDITGTLPIGNAAITDIAVKNTNPDSVWVTFSGFSSNNKVFFSSNGGTTWTNVSAGLPNLPVNCVTFDNNTEDGIYVGIDGGVYYRDSSMVGFVNVSSGLPNVIVNKLRISYSENKIYAGTYGRSIWKSDLYDQSTSHPQIQANFQSNKTQVCKNNSVNFTDLSTNNPTSWTWYFQSGNPSISHSKNPGPIYYSTVGSFNVKLIASNAYNADTILKPNFINVVACPTGIDKVKENKFVDAYYSPSDKNLTLKVSDIPLGQYNLLIFNEIGQKVINENVNVNTKEEQFKYNLSQLKDGVYFVRLKGSKKFYNRKFVKY